MSANFCFDELKATERLPIPSGLARAIMQLLQKGDVGVQKQAERVKAAPA